MTHDKLFQAATLLGCITVLSFASSAHAVQQLHGAGASFPFPLYAAWFMQFSRDAAVRAHYNSAGTRVSYEAASDAAGIEALVSATVDFAASDTPVSDQDIERVEGGVVPLPMTAGEVVLAYNLPGVAALKLPRAVYPRIFAGAITSWNDPAIAEANPGVALPAQPITVVVRADAARASAVLSAHLSAIDTAFRDAVGESRSPEWPQHDHLVRAPMNDGVTAQLTRTPGAIGYVEYGYARLAGLTQLALLENKAGNFVAAGPASGTDAIAGSRFPEATLPGGVPDLRLRLLDPEAEGAYPITSLSWMLFYATGYEGDRLTAVRDLINYCASADAQRQAEPLGYVPLPDTLLERVRKAAESIE
jgi:phosphate transport system substrate-binding protein